MFSQLAAGVGLVGSFWLTIILQTIGAVDMPGKGARKLPSPRAYVAILMSWAVLFVIAGISRNAAKAAERLGWLLVLTSLVVGPAGQRLISVFNTIGADYGTPPPTSSNNGG